ncbi:tetratricopeptide repeat protein, partial [Methylocucumis oryzae]|uniref:tetratricopeptide repeat protein n=1 Tax=Methylocucumis oryzae TaxID=1632867 RepID=UPI0006971D86
MNMNRYQIRIVCTAATITFLGGCSAFQPQAKLEIRAVESVERSAKQDALAEGRALLNLGQNANAISAFREALREQPDSGDAYNGLAVAYDRIGRKDLAQRYFELALSFEPENPKFRANLARLYTRNGQPQLAAALIEPVQNAEPPAPQEEIKFVTALSDQAPQEAAPAITIETPALAALAVDSPIAAAAPMLPRLEVPTGPDADMSSPVIQAVYRPQATMAIRPAAIQPRQLPKPSAPTFPDRPSERQPFDVPRQVTAPAQREGIRLERVSLGEVRLVTRPSTPVAVTQKRDFESFGARLANWLPDAIAIEQAGQP